MDTSLASEGNKLRIDLEKLSEEQLEDLARLVWKKLRNEVRRECDRAGRM